MRYYLNPDLDFERWLLVTESEWLGSFKYTLPEDKEQQMYDFYMVMFLKGRSSLDAAAAQQAQQGTNINQFGYARTNPEGPGGGFMGEEDKVDRALDEVYDVLLPTLKKNLLEATFFAVCAEMHHILDANKADKVVTLVEDKFGGAASKSFKEYLKHMTLHKTYDLKPILRKPGTAVVKRAESSSADYIASYYAALKSGFTKMEFTQVASYLFASAGWSSSYGGDNWRQIAEAYGKLNNAAPGPQTAIYIDHVYDLEHNTGSVFTKMQSYAKAGRFTWIKRALDNKANIKSPYEIIDKISPQLKPLALRTAKLKFGMTYEDFKNPQDQVKPSDSKLLGDLGVSDRKDGNEIDLGTLSPSDRFLTDSNKEPIWERYKKMDGAVDRRIARLVLYYLIGDGFAYSTSRVAEYWEKLATAIGQNLVKANDGSIHRATFDNYPLYASEVESLSAVEYKHQTELARDFSHTLNRIPAQVVYEISKEQAVKQTNDFGHLELHVELTVDAKNKLDSLLVAVKPGSARLQFQAYTGYKEEPARNWIKLRIARLIVEGKIVSKAPKEDPADKVAQDNAAIKNNYAHLDGPATLKISRMMLPHMQPADEKKLYERYAKIGEAIGDVILPANPNGSLSFVVPGGAVTWAEVKEEFGKELARQQKLEYIHQHVGTGNNTLSTGMGAYSLSFQQAKEEDEKYTSAMSDIYLNTGTRAEIEAMLVAQPVSSKFIAAIKRFREATNYNLLAAKMWTTLKIVSMIATGFMSPSQAPSPHTQVTWPSSWPSNKEDAKVMLQNRLKYVEGQSPSQEFARIILTVPEPELDAAVNGLVTLGFVGSGVADAIKLYYKKDRALQWYWEKIHHLGDLYNQATSINAAKEINSANIPYMSPSTLQVVKDAVASNNVLAGVKTIREATGFNLMSAKALAHYFMNAAKVNTPEDYPAGWSTNTEFAKNDLVKKLAEIDGSPQLKAARAILNNITPTQWPSAIKVMKHWKLISDSLSDDIILKAAQSEAIKKEIWEKTLYQMPAEIYTLTPTQAAEALIKLPQPSNMPWISGNTWDAVMQLIEKHDHISAIKRLRAATGSGLAASKAMVEFMALEMIKSKGVPPPPPTS